MVGRDREPSPVAVAVRAGPASVMSEIPDAPVDITLEHADLIRRAGRRSYSRECPKWVGKRMSAMRRSWVESGHSREAERTAAIG